MGKMFFILAVSVLFGTVVGCKDIGGEKVLFGDWENRNTAGTEYTNKVLRIEKATKEMKADKENEADGTYKMAYTINGEIVTDSVIEGTWIFRSVYNKDKMGYINSIEMTPKEGKVQTFEFYFDGSMLMLIDRAATVPTTDSYYKVEGGIKGF